jgi:hypothetical protein
MTTADFLEQRTFREKMELEIENEGQKMKAVRKKLADQDEHTA